MAKGMDVVGRYRRAMTPVIFDSQPTVRRSGATVDIE